MHLIIGGKGQGKLRYALSLGFTEGEQLYPPIACTTVTVTKGIENLAQFAKSKGITYAQLKDFNPWLRDTSLMNKSGRTYVLKIPTRAGMHYNPKKTVPHNRRWVID